MKTTSLIIDILILAVLSACLFFMVMIYQKQQNISTELKRTRKVNVKTLIYTKKNLEVNSELKNGVIDLSTYYKKR